MFVRMWVCVCVCGREAGRLVCLYVEHPDSKHFDASEAERGSPTNSSIRQSQLTHICSAAAAAAFGGIPAGWEQQNSLYFALKRDFCKPYALELRKGNIT